MAHSLGRERDMNSERKFGIFAVILGVYSVLALIGYELTRRHRKYASSIAILSINLLGFLAMMWILSGFFDLLLIGQFLLGGVVMVVISTALWSPLRLPSKSVDKSTCPGDRELRCKVPTVFAFHPSGRPSVSSVICLYGHHLLLPSPPWLRDLDG